MAPSLRKVRDVLHAGKTCALCLKPIKPGQRTVLYRGERVHRGCVVFQPK
jgi:hypothetical protein